MTLYRPLFGHSLCDAGIRLASLFPATRVVPAVSATLVNSRDSTVNDIRRDKFRKVIRPKAGRFRLPVPELPRLDDLVGLSVDRGHDANRILYGPSLRVLFASFYHCHKEIDTLLLASIRSFCGEVACAGYREVRARRVGDDQIPSFCNFN